ncbi:hypothetical protein PG614_10305, partial [Riemerella anatipestifer]|nr:hypothetical protein [Riemerella anatipestifer]MDY3534280.1 hypothetical protein [Riemerella anatipestifer]MDY3536338.1 hypothetical protein [Riemerella anatipestifer]
PDELVASRTSHIKRFCKIPSRKQSFQRKLRKAAEPLAVIINQQLTPKIKMEKTSIYKFYRLGQLLNEFATDEQPTNIELYNRITNFLDFVDELNLKVTKSAITLGDLNKYHKKLASEIKIKPRDMVNLDLANKVSNEIKKLLTTFEAEIIHKNSFVINEKKYKLEYLIDNQAKLFNDTGVLLEAPFEVQFHVIESANCIAFDRYTASAFHILLATEGYVKFFNDNFYESDSDDEDTYTFYDLIKETQEILKEFKYDSELISFLHIIRKYYRNQSQHSNRKFTETEATDLFTICIKVMNELFAIVHKNA